MNIPQFTKEDIPCFQTTDLFVDEMQMGVSGKGRCFPIYILYLFKEVIKQK